MGLTSTGDLKVISYEHPDLFVYCYGFFMSAFVWCLWCLVLVYSGRYAHFATQLTSCNFGVYAIDWIGR